MRKAEADFVPFYDASYRAADWSRYENLPAFDASNRGNAYRIYPEMAAESFEQILVQSWMPGIIQRFCRMKQPFGGTIHVI
jgi:hypothetical protein